MVLVSVVPAFALTATWTPNTEADMKEYVMYMCKVKGCVVAQSADQQVAVIPHSQTPSWVLPASIEGTIAVSARDTSGNESGLSNQAPFDSAPPKAPAGAVVGK